MSDSIEKYNTVLPGNSAAPFSAIHWILIACVLLVEIGVLIALGCLGPVSGLFLLGGSGFIVLSLTRPTAAWLAVIALVPFSLEIMLPGTRSAVQVPTEPMILLLEGIWILRLLQGGRIRLPARRLTWATAAWMAVLFFSCLYSDYSRASLKTSVNLLWYVVFGLFLAGASLRNLRDLRRFAMAVSVPAAAVSIYYLQNVIRSGLSVETSNLGAMPFFAEHGTFAAYLCFAFPMAVLCFLWAGQYLSRFFFAGVGLLVLTGILCSLTRAAWLGFLGIVAVFIFYSIRSRRGRQMAIVFLILVLALGGIAAARSASTLSQHAQSVVDVRTNISNLERINRWAAAYDMFRAHPVGGVGFGAYKHHYYEFRRVRLATTESGPKAGAHSIYLSVLSETGVIGGIVGLLFTVSLFSLVGRIIARCRRLGEQGRPIGQMTIALTAGLVSYAVHGFFNYYPSWDKVNVPIWTFVGALAACAGLAASMESTDGTTRHAS